LKKVNRDLFTDALTTAYYEVAPKKLAGINQQHAMSEVEDYISQFEPHIQEKLNSLRQVFFDVLPHVEESIRYKMPAYKVEKHYLYFAAYKKHIGFYPVYGLPEIEDEVAKYRAPKTKDSLHFLHDKPLPIELIEKIIKLKSSL
jgi:uncharacterized protein YdhG (YjbR/CyaY superfamily)